MAAKQKRQRAVITLTDDDTGGFHAELVLEPSIKNRRTPSPCVNAALALTKIIVTQKDALAEGPK